MMASLGPLALVLLGMLTLSEPLSLLAGCDDKVIASAAPGRRSVLVFGQSNATGWASSAGIVSATDYTTPFPQVSLAQKLGLAGPANPIVWTNYATGSLKPRPAESPDFGVELPLGHQLASVGQFDIIKVAVNSSSLGSDWLPPGIDNLVTQAISFATAQAAALGSPPAAIVWIQGENDASNAGFAAAYQGNLGLLLAAFRATWPGIPFIVVKLSNSNVGANKATVRAAEVAFVGATANAYLVDADDLVNDGLHFNPNAYIKLGKRITTAVCIALGIAPPADPNPPTITTNKGAYANAENIQVTWANLADTLDWVNVVEQGSAANRNFGMWCYTNGTQVAPGAVTPAGSKTFVGGLGVPGTYVVRLLSNDTFTLIAESAPFTVAP